MNWLEAWDKLKPHGDVIKRHWGDFLKMGILVALVSGGFILWLTGNRIKDLHSRLEVQNERLTTLHERNTTLNERNATLNERLTSLNERIEDYRERLGYTNPVRDRFAGLTHAELKQLCLDHVMQFRQVLAEAEARDRETSDAWLRAHRQATSEEERQRLFQAHSTAAGQQAQALRIHYTSEFQANLLLCSGSSLPIQSTKSQLRSCIH